MGVASGWNVWVWLVGVVSRRWESWEWVESMGVASGCGCKEVYRFLHTIYLSLFLLYLFFFAAASLLLFIFKMFFVIIIGLIIKLIMYSTSSLILLNKSTVLTQPVLIRVI